MSYSYDKSIVKLNTIFLKLLSVLCWELPRGHHLSLAHACQQAWAQPWVVLARSQLCITDRRSRPCVSFFLKSNWCEERRQKANLSSTQFTLIPKSVKLRSMLSYIARVPLAFSSSKQLGRDINEAYVRWFIKQYKNCYSLLRPNVVVLYSCVRSMMTKWSLP